jgi:hypothetical protein
MNLKKKFPMAIMVIALLFGVACSCTAAPVDTTEPPVEPTTWEFSLRVGMPRDLVTKYGGETAVKAKVEAQIASANTRYATAFAKPIVWRMNEFYVFDGPALDQLIGTPTGSDFRLLYSENTEFDDGGWKPNWRTIVIRWTPEMGGVFGPYGADSLVHELGHARGAIDMYGLAVNGGNNPVNGQAYVPEGGFMSYPYGATSFDSYSTRIINASKDEVYNDDHVVTGSLPNTFSVHATKNGLPVGGATVALYPVEWYTVSVKPTPTQTGATDASGSWTIPSSPFHPNPFDYWKMDYPLLLVKVTSDSSSGYGWLALPDAGNWYFTHPGEAYQLTIPIA